MRAGDDRVRFSERVNATVLSHGGRGLDRVIGGSGDDRLNGGPGDDAIFSQGGRDVLIGSHGDYLDAGDGADVVRAGFETIEEAIYCGFGRDVAYIDEADPRPLFCEKVHFGRRGRR